MKKAFAVVLAVASLAAVAVPAASAAPQAPSGKTIFPRLGTYIFPSGFDIGCQYARIAGQRALLCTSYESNRDVGIVLFNGHLEVFAGKNARTIYSHGW